MGKGKAASSPNGWRLCCVNRRKRAQAARYSQFKFMTAGGIGGCGSSGPGGCGGFGVC